MDKISLQRCIDAFAKTRHAVLGDMVIDEMIYGNVDRLSREAPVMILRHQKTDIILGGAANAVHNVAAYGAEAHAIGVWGADYHAPLLKAAMEAASIHTQHMVVDATRPTTTKTRISGVVNASITQQMLRIDRESQAPLEASVHDALEAALRQCLPHCHGLLLSDYRLGVLPPERVERMMHLAKQLGCAHIAVDSQQKLAHFKGASILTPNQTEAEANVGYALDSRNSILKAGTQLLQSAEAKHLLITLGQEGMALFSAESGHVHFIPAFNKSHVFDVTGAGDTVVATWLVARCAGSSALEAAVLGNLAASLVVRIFGSATTTTQTLSNALSALEPALLDAIETLSL